jgi:hypothetical protein
MQFANRLAGCELINSEWSADVRFGAHSGLKSDITALPKSADIVAKVFLGRRTKIFRAADASYARRREGPSFRPKATADLPGGAEKLRSSSEAQKSTFARFLQLIDFRLLQQYLP